MGESETELELEVAIKKLETQGTYTRKRRVLGH